MVRVFIALFVAGAALVSTACAQEPAASQETEASQLRKAIEYQSKQIESLTQQVSRLAQLLENRGDDPTRKMEPAAGAPFPPPTASETIDVPKAVPATPPAGITHVVARGETLTSIAKLYKVAISDLQKVNRIENARTLQIGQTLTIPTPASPEQPKTP